MTVQFSKRCQRTRPSAIRALFKKCVDPEIISLGGGSPAKEGFPLEEIRDITKQIIDEQTVDMLVYGLTPGYKPLREAYLKWIVEPKGVKASLENVICFTGSGQGIDLTCEILLDEGDVVFVESPTFLGTLNVLNKRGVKLVPIPTDEHGLIVEELEKKAKELHPKLLYTIPAFQNPAGVTMTWEKRVKVYELAKKYGVMILEDNPYGELRVAGEDIPAIKTLDKDGIVIYSGSFSKILSPGIRVAYTIANKAVISKMTVGKQASDVHTPVFNQMLVNEWMTNYDFRSHIDKIRDIYRGKLDLMCGLIDSELGGFFSYVKPEGGLFVWCDLPANVDMLEFVKASADAGVAVVPGTAFMMYPEDKTNSVRLNFSTPTDEGIVKGMKILGKVKDQFV